MDDVKRNMVVNAAEKQARKEGREAMVTGVTKSQQSSEAPVVIEVEELENSVSEASDAREGVDPVFDPEVEEVSGPSVDE